MKNSAWIEEKKMCIGTAISMHLWRIERSIRFDLRVTRQWPTSSTCVPLSTHYIPIAVNCVKFSPWLIRSGTLNAPQIVRSSYFHCISHENQAFLFSWVDIIFNVRVNTQIASMPSIPSRFQLNKWQRHQMHNYRINKMLHKKKTTNQDRFHREGEREAEKEESHKINGKKKS